MFDGTITKEKIKNAYYLIYEFKTNTCVKSDSEVTSTAGFEKYFPKSELVGPSGIFSNSSLSVGPQPAIPGNISVDRTAILAVQMIYVLVFFHKKEINYFEPTQMSIFLTSAIVMQNNSILLRLLQHHAQDVLGHLALFLRVENLLSLSMVSRQFKDCADSIWESFFAKTIKFVLRPSLYHRPTDVEMGLDTNSMLLTSRYTVQNLHEVWKFCASSNLKAGSSINMRLSVIIPSQFVKFNFGKEEIVYPKSDLTENNFRCMMIVHEWRIRERLCTTHRHPQLGEVQEFRLKLIAQKINCCNSSIPKRLKDRWPHWNPKSNLLIPCQLELCVNPNFLPLWKDNGLAFTKAYNNSPNTIYLDPKVRIDLLAYKQMVSAAGQTNIRELAVCRSLRTCMNCKQRRLKYSSFNVSEKSHRRLCHVCFSLFYVKCNTLRSTYKLNTNSVVCNMISKVPKFFFWQCDYFTGSAHIMYNKVQLANGLGYATWDMFIQNNYQNPLPFSRNKTNNLTRFNFARSAFSE